MGNIFFKGFKTGILQQLSPDKIRWLTVKIAGIKTVTILINE
jgi:hypothetical protein